MSNKEAASRLKVIMMRTKLDIMKAVPRRSNASDLPTVKVWGSIMMTADSTVTMPDLFFQAEIQVYEDASFEVLSMKPLYGSIEGVAKKAMRPYKEVLRSLLEDSSLKLIGVSK